MGTGVRRGDPVDQLLDEYERSAAPRRAADPEIFPWRRGRDHRNLFGRECQATLTLEEAEPEIERAEARRYQRGWARLAREGRRCGASVRYADVDSWKREFTRTVRPGPPRAKVPPPPPLPRRKRSTSPPARWQALEARRVVGKFMVRRESGWLLGTGKVLRVPAGAPEEVRIFDTAEEAEAEARLGYREVVVRSEELPEYFPGWWFE